MGDSGHRGGISTTNSSPPQRAATISRLPGAVRLQDLGGIWISNGVGPAGWPIVSLKSAEPVQIDMEQGSAFRAPGKLTACSQQIVQNSGGWAGLSAKFVHGRVFRRGLRAAPVRRCAAS